MKKAIVIGCHVNGLGVIRSLRTKGFHVIAIHYNELADFAHTSKYVSEIAKSPHPRLQEDLFINFLLANASRWKGAIILETNDDAATALSKNKKRLEEHFKIPTPAWNVLRKLIAKLETYQLAGQRKVPYPQTFLPESMNELHEIQKEFIYPCILKSFVGHLFFSEFKAKTFKVNDPNELVSRFEQCIKPDIK